MLFHAAGACALCAGAADATAAADGVFRGDYWEVEHTGYLQPCSGGDRLKVAGGSAGAELSSTYAVLATAETRQVFVEVRGRRRGGVLVVNEMERIQAGGPGCKEVMRNSMFKAYGPLPEWNLYIDPSGLRLRTLEDGGPILFPYHTYWRDGAAWVFDSRNAKGDIHVELRRGRCVDPVNGGRFGFQAKVAYGEKHYAGCAYPGSLFRP